MKCSVGIMVLGITYGTLNAAATIERTSSTDDHVEIVLERLKFVPHSSTQCLSLKDLCIQKALAYPKLRMAFQDTSYLNTDLCTYYKDFLKFGMQRCVMREYLIESYADCTYDLLNLGDFPWHCLETNYVGHMEKLVEWGAPVNVELVSYIRKAHGERQKRILLTPLACVVIQGKERAVSTFLHHGAQCNIELWNIRKNYSNGTYNWEKQRSLVQQALINNRENIVIHLLQSGAHIHADEPGAFNALTYATQQQLLKVVKVLCEQGEESCAQAWAVLYSNALSSADRRSLARLFVDNGYDQNDTRIFGRALLEECVLLHDIDTARTLACHPLCRPTKHTFKRALCKAYKSNDTEMIALLNPFVRLSKHQRLLGCIKKKIWKPRMPKQ